MFKSPIHPAYPVAELKYFARVYTASFAFFEALWEVHDPFSTCMNLPNN